MNVNVLLNFLDEWMPIGASIFRKLPVRCVKWNLILIITKMSETV